MENNRLNNKGRSKMKSLIFLLSASMMASSVMAGDLTVITASSKTSPTTGVAMTYYKAINGTHDFYQAENCQDGVKKFDNTANSVIVFGTNLTTGALSKGQTCMPKITKDNILFYGEQFYHICTKKGSGKTFMTPRATIGMTSLKPAANIANDINAQNGTSLVGLPFSGSRDILYQVLSGDLDLGLIGTSVAAKHERAGDITCIASTNPRDKDFIGHQLKMKSAEMKLPVVILHNIQDPKLLASAQAAVASPAFVTLLKEGEFVGVTTKSTQRLFEKIESDILMFHESYGIKKATTISLNPFLLQTQH
jgi:hypothetical protein